VRTSHDRYLFALFVARWGFAVFVAFAILLGGVVALTVTAPSEVPGVALQAAPVYRVEVGLAVFFALYVVAIALALALRNRGFTEIGTAGVKARDLAAAADQHEEVASMELLEEVMKEVGELRVWREEIQDGG
jgi:hypothetical protein